MLLQSCLTPCDPIDSSPSGSSIPGILQARKLECVAIPFSNACMHAKSLQSCLILWDSMDSSPQGSSVHRILQARILEWVAISFSTSPIISWQIDVETMETVRGFILGAPISLQMVTAAMKLKDASSLKEKQ